MNIGKLEKLNGKFAIPLLAFSLALVYIWFGYLKAIDASPVKYLIEVCFPYFPEPLFIHVLGIGEVIIGLGFLFKKTRKISSVLLVFHMLGIFVGFITNPSIYFNHGNLILLTTYGEFVAKNVVLITGALVVYKES